MSEVIQDAQQEFWRPPVQLEMPAAVLTAVPASAGMAEVCPSCSTEFMIGSRFCHACGTTRPERGIAGETSARPLQSDFLVGKLSMLRAATGDMFADGIPLPSWLHYLHFHEIKRWVGLPTAPLIAFLIGLGCVAGAVGVSVFYKAQTALEFQAVQMWRIEWLLAATASFVAGILLKTSDRDE